MKFLSIIAAMGLLLTINPAEAATRAVSCDGCSASAMASSAKRFNNGDIVFVLNVTHADIRKYRIHEVQMDSRYSRVIKVAESLTVDGDLRNAWENYSISVEDVLVTGIYVLPANFPIQSVAGAFLDQKRATTDIENWLMNHGLFQQMARDMSAVVTYLVKELLSKVDLGDAISSIVVTIKFPDGSTVDVTISYSTNSLSGEPRIELDGFENAMLPDGSAAPTTGWGFSGFEYYGSGQSLQEWIAWAYHNGVTFSSGGGDGTYMSCSISGAKIICKVIKKTK